MALSDAALVEDYLRWLVIEKGRRPATVEAYRRDLSRFTAWCAGHRYSMGTLTRDEAEKYLLALRTGGFAPSTVTRHWSAVRGWSAYLVREGVREVNPTARLSSGRRPRSLPKPLGEVDVIRLIESIDGVGPRDLRDRALLEFLYGTGARVSEAVGVELQHLDFDEELVVVTGKGNKQRLIPMGLALQHALHGYLRPGGRPHLVGTTSRAFLFLNHLGGPLTRQGVSLIVRHRALAVGVDTRRVSPHVFRHSCATHMLDHGADIRIVQEMLGHASIATTQVYTAVTVKSLQAAYADAHPRAHE